METPILPAEMPDEKLNVTQLAKLYGRSRRWMQNKFNEHRIYEAIGERDGYSLNAQQLLIAFILYEPPPGKYYRAYLLMERRGAIKEFAQLYGLETFKSSSLISNLQHGRNPI